jgi:hypothetical protein
VSLRRLLTLALLLAVPATASAADDTHPTLAQAGAADDPPVLVPWKKIGDIGLGISKGRVQYQYGTMGHGFHYKQSWKGNSYCAGWCLQGYYVLHGGRVYITFYGGRVGEISFSTPYYRTASDLGVGSTIPLGPCHRTASHVCEHRWNGFVYQGEGKYPNTWIKRQPSGRGYTMIEMSHGKVRGFYFTAAND